MFACRVAKHAAKKWGMPKLMTSPRTTSSHSESDLAEWKYFVDEWAHVMQAQV